MRVVEGESDLARYIIDETKANTGAPPVFTQGAVQRYNSETGIWLPWPSIEIQQRLQSYHRRLTKVDTYKMEGAVKILRVLAHANLFFETAPVGVAFHNGFAHVTKAGIEVKPHHPDHRARFGFNFEYVERDPTEFKSCLAEIFKYEVAPGILKPDLDAKQKIDMIQECIGACMLGIAPMFEFAFVWLGKEGRNGKSIIIDSISPLFPDDTRKAIEPQKWNHEYYRFELIGCRINLVGELPRTEILEGSAFKAIISGNEIMGRTLNEKPVTFRPIAGHIFSCNKLPAVADLDEAFWRRWIIINFNRRFTNEVLRSDIITKNTSDLPALASWFVRGAQRLLARGNYTLLKSSDKSKLSWKLKADQVAAFLDECCTIDEGRSPVGLTYNTYKKWAFATGHNKLSFTTFRERMSWQPGIIKTRGDTGYVYNFAIREESEWDIRKEEA